MHIQSDSFIGVPMYNVEKFRSSCRFSFQINYHTLGISAIQNLLKDKCKWRSYAQWRTNARDDLKFVGCSGVDDMKLMMTVFGERTLKCIFIQCSTQTFSGWNIHSKVISSLQQVPSHRRCVCTFALSYIFVCLKSTSLLCQYLMELHLLVCHKLICVYFKLFN